MILFNDPFHSVDRACCSYEHHRRTSHKTPPSLSFMNNLIMASSQMAFRNFTRTLIHSIVLGIMLSSLAGCGSGGSQGGPSISTSSSPTGATATLAWDPVQDPSVTAYHVHYGKQSVGQAGMCSYQETQSVNAPTATITGLDPNTRYFFAVSAYNGLESLCSNEVSTVTPPSQT
jgi:hypothetical protein